MDTTNAEPTVQDPPPPPPPGRPRLARPERDRVVAGVSGALSNEFGIRRTWVRLAFVALLFAGGAGVALYGLGMLLIPDERDDESTMQRWLNGDDRLRAVVAVIVLLVAFGFLTGGWWGGHLFPGGWALIAVGLILLLGPRLDRRRHPRTDGPPPVPFGPADPTGVSDASGAAATTSAFGPGAANDPTAATATYTPTAPTVPSPPVAFDPEAAAAAERRKQEREARSARRWRRFLATIASLVILTVVGTGVAISTGALPLGWGWGRHTYQPASTSELRHYRLFAGEQDIDLTNLHLRDGQTVTVKVDQRFGRLHVTVPANAKVELKTHVRAGVNDAFNQRSDGFSSDQPLNSSTPTAWNNGPTIVLSARVTAGNLVVDRPAT